ncbi:hypothetical protein CYLTODRAFT_426126 [Cylindrobasidium torrendii FP15055 ss-10]|uniref:Uncharacterized protein n=1 Tax=Cylindrobasidium torrendii FP15055 ss-10 TaxID=1314674 RepID=A0A0D7AYG5_9AGAR|nr:hypothetical protein CYLTODRAFT_427486 [Cylindrobasidium torrendii FP15055 ss-10]KIY62703.1 hypothetical protein CYLTODRAFT_426716 [Cylindrobasidium torrendii FP15055 ss-10]KIY63403.1 hypothetical protein CYLTODRAFT_426126 [Cylindrobasidium torrendii FP15055 ss-10]
MPLARKLRMVEASPEIPVPQSRSAAFESALILPLYQFIVALMPLLDGLAQTKLQKAVHNKLDSRLPFREHAPTRHHVRTDARFCGLHTDDVLGVVRSLVINRGLTFNTEMVFTHGAWFDSPDDWASFRGTSSKDEPKYVNKMAYGRTQGRHSDNFGLLWEQSEALANAIKSVPIGKMTFTRALYLMRKPCHILSFGGLTSLLLVEDLVYAGLVEMPSLEEFAKEAARLKMGAVSAMTEMSLVANGASTAECSAAFVRVFNYLDDVLTAEQKAKMSFDMFMVEHALCKFTRCKRWHQNRRTTT